MSNTFKILANSLFGVMMTRCEKFKDFKIVTKESQADKQIKKPNFSCRNIINENLTILELEKTSVVYKYPILIGSIILQNSKVHMFNYLYRIYPRLFGNYKVLYMDTDSIYAKLNISHNKYLKILEENNYLFGKNIGMMEPECINNPIKDFISLSSKCYSYICKNDIENNKNKLKNNIVHSKGIANSYKNKYIDHALFKKTLLENMKPDKISFNNISVKNQQIKTNKIVKNNIEFLNDKRYISNINENIPHTLYIYRMIYEQNCYNLNVKYFDNLIEINKKNFPNKFIRFKIYENILHFLKLYKLNILTKYYDQEFLIYNELDLKNVFKKLEI